MEVYMKVFSSKFLIYLFIIFVIQWQCFEVLYYIYVCLVLKMWVVEWNCYCKVSEFGFENEKMIVLCKLG